MKDDIENAYLYFVKYLEVRNVALYIFVVFVSFATLPIGVCAQGWEWGRANTGGEIDAWPIATDSWGNVFAAGVATHRTVYFGTDSISLSGGEPCVITKFDSSGKYLWGISTQKGYSWPINIAVDRNGNCFLFGSFLDTLQIDSKIIVDTLPFPNAQYFIAKFDPNGNLLWLLNDGCAQDNAANLGGLEVLTTGGIVTDNSNNVYVAANYNLRQVNVGGQTYFNSDVSGVTDDFLLVKYDSDGNFVWASSIGGHGSDDVYGLTITPKGELYVAGAFTSQSITFGDITISNTSGVGNVFVAEFDQYGKPVWGCSGGGVTKSCAVGIASDPYSNIYVTGWMKDSSIALCGTTIDNSYPGQYILFLTKLDSSNQVSWYKTIGSPSGRTNGFSIAMSTCGAIWVSGNFSKDVTIDGHLLQVPRGSFDPVFIAGYTPKGQYVGSAALQSGADDQNGIACDAVGNIYLCADYVDVDSFTVGPDIVSEQRSGNELLYIAKYKFADVATPDTSYLSVDTIVCLNTAQVLNAPPGYAGYLWSTGSTKPFIDINETGVYWVIGEGGCTVIDSISVNTSNDICGCKAILPNAFTPNNDGKDDAFCPLFQNNCSVSAYSFAIYNRWGQQVFFSNDPSAKWNGFFLGAKADVGVYSYYLKYKSGEKNALFQAKGDVILIR